MTTSHEPAYPEDGMPKERYRAYHVERAKGGVALTMTAGSAAVSRDSPPVFNNILAFKDEVVPWMKSLADECHEHGAAVMIQLTHLGRRTRWDRATGCPWSRRRIARSRRIAPFRRRSRIGTSSGSSRTMRTPPSACRPPVSTASSCEAYGHLMDQFWSPLTNTLEAPYGGSLDDRLKFTFDVLTAIRNASAPDFIVGIRYTGDEIHRRRPHARKTGWTSRRRLKESGMVDFLNIDARPSSIPMPD